MTVGDLSSIPVEAKEALQDLSRSVLTALKPPPGPYALFHHIAHTMVRVEDCDRILHRMLMARERLNELSRMQAAAMPKNWPSGVPYPKDIQVIMHEDSEITGHMMMDFESLFIFGGILLDQWALIAIAVGNLTTLSHSIKKEHPFRELVDYFDRGGTSKRLDPLWNQYREQMLWLHYQLRFYRNRFVVHGNRPWQRGTTRPVIGDDFNLFIPSPPGWNDDTKLDKEAMEMIHLAHLIPHHAGAVQWKGRSRELIERLFAVIPLIPTRPDRERVASLFGKLGGSTPSFRVVGNNLMTFVRDATKALTTIAMDDPSVIDLGIPEARI